MKSVYQNPQATSAVWVYFACGFPPCFPLRYVFFDQPQTKNGVNSFGGLGATLIDSLDTLYIMGLHEQFQKARE